VKMAINCPQCNSENPEDSSFCSKCGSQLIGAEEKPAFNKTFYKSIQELTPGTTLADQYEIIEELGRGGMGVVYRAKDRKLGREVAIKVLPKEFSQDWERQARFEREAKLLASLNHPNIAAIYGLEESEGIHFLVLELAEGKTLAERVVSRSLETEETLKIFHQIAEALETAHEKRIIHRDLKPANIKVTPEGKIKVLDFGLAKAFETAVSGESPAIDLSKSPTITVESSHTGVILGTAAYMSPEQARGRPLDKRTDIWSFGCVLYEAFSGQQAYRGETISDSIAAILKSEPNWKALPETTPLKIRDLLRRCLQKDPHKRLHDIADARIEIEEVLGGPSAEIVPETRLAPRRRYLPWILAFLLLAFSCIVLWKMLRSPPEISHQVKHLLIILPDNAPLAPAGASPLGEGRPILTLSPDGSCLIYVAIINGHTKLYMRQMDREESAPIPGTEGAHTPFFSPDGEWVGFFADGKLKKVSLSGGEPEVLCSASLPFGGSWGPDGTIYFTPSQFTGIWQISSAGGTPKPLTEVNIQKGESGHYWPEILPGGDAMLFSLRDGGIGITSLHSNERKMLLESGIYARYSPTGHLVYGEAGKLRAVSFDLTRWEVTNSPVTILEGVRTERLGAAQFAFSKDRSLVFVPGIDAREGSLMWIDRNGKEEPLKLPRGIFGSFKISPNGKALAITIIDGKSSDVWIYDITRNMLTRFSFGQKDSSPLWTPDGKWIVFRSSRDGAAHFYRKLADGTGEYEQITDKEPCQIGSPCSFSPNGELITLYGRTAQSQDLWILSLKGRKEIHPFLQMPFLESFPAFSPNGLWIAYTSAESGRWEVYVRPYPGPGGGKWRVSTDGGEEARWSQNGRELVYRFGTQWFVVDIAAGTEFRAGKPRVLFEGPYINIPGYSYDVSPDGQRLLVVKGSEQELAVGQLHVITNWFEELKRLVTTGK